MTQYLLKPDLQAKELIYALEKYSAVRIVISGFSLGNRRGMNAIVKNLNGDLELKVSKDWIFYKSGIEIITIHPDKTQCFKLEYQKDNYFRIYPYFDDPNDERMITPTYSTFRNVVDDYLLEIYFNGKILLEKDGKKYWKIKKKL